MHLPKWARIHQVVEVDMCARLMRIRAVCSESWMGALWVTKFRRKTKTLVKLCIWICAVWRTRQLAPYVGCEFINPFMPNGISNPYHLGQSISDLRVAGWYFSLYSNFNRTFCKQKVESLIRRRVLRRLLWFCTACWCPTKRTLGLNGLNLNNKP